MQQAKIETVFNVDPSPLTLDLCRKVDRQKDKVLSLGDDQNLNAIVAWR